MRFKKKSFRIVLVRLYEHDDHVTLWDLSCHKFQTVDSQDKFKTGARKNLSGVLHYLPIHAQWLQTALQDQSVGYHEKYMNGGNTGVFKKNSVCSSTHPHENSGATSVYRKGNISDEFREWRTGAPEFMDDRIII